MHPHRDAGADLTWRAEQELMSRAAPRRRAEGVNRAMFLGEVVGTAVLILLGDGVVAGVLLNRSKAQNGGWIVITWALGHRGARGRLHERRRHRAASRI